MKHKEFFLSILMLVSVGITQIQAISSVFQILPKPLHIEELKGKGIYLTITDKDVLESEEGYVLSLNEKGVLLPLGVKPDLSAKSQNSDWLFLYELPMVEKVQKWLNSKTIK